MQVPGSMGGMALQQVTDPLTTDTLLHAAMEGRSTDCIRFLISVGCEVMHRNQSDETPLHTACMNDSLEGLNVALEADDLDLEVTDRWQRTLILKALVYNSYRVFYKLLNLNVSLNTQDIYGLSVMHVAVSYNHLDLVRELAERGASLNMLNERYRAPLSLAISAHNPDMVRELLLLGASTLNRKSTEPVLTAISELIRRSEDGVVCERSEETLHLMLAAHGLPLQSDEPNVFQRVLVSSDLERFLPLLHKMFVCSDCPYDDLRTRVSSLQQSRRSNVPKIRTAVSLFDLARRVARSALMASGHNMIWAVERLQSDVPPAVRGLLLLKDCDRKQFSP